MTSLYPVPVDAVLEQKLRHVMTVFLQENAQINLSALRTEEACWTGNILDSLPFLDIAEKLFPDSPSLSVADMGTGGGFPLLPLAAARPEWTFTGIDATKKKVDAIGRIAAACGIRNLTLVSDRAETLGHGKLREKFDVLTCRAVDVISTDLEYCAPLVRDGGYVVLWKSLKIEDELRASEKAQETLHCALQELHPYTLPDPAGTRQLLVFRKTGVLDKSYPRTIGLPKKHPL